MNTLYLRNLKKLLVERWQVDPLYIIIEIVYILAVSAMQTLIPWCLGRVIDLVSAKAVGSLYDPVF